ncbi:MAG: fatty acid--CoA ligase [Deltaproteobacteria bacterium]|nr:fatty acid--CoA ligase [Deltaproteobacteria bacterium]MBW2363923.1 fatty acid--CoA ligase [Deltaproteobacteria bacterium]
MTYKKIERTPSAHYFPLLIKNILESSQVLAPNQEIVYRDTLRYTYKTLADRIARLANALTTLGVKPGDTVAVMDWDTNRYFECFFAIPMMGAVLHTINIRLSPEQILYTINHAKDDVILINAEFFPLLEPVKDQIKTVKKFILLKDDDNMPETGLVMDGEYEELLSQGGSDYDFPEFDEDTMATTFYTTGTTGLPKGVYFSHRQIVLHTLGAAAGFSGIKSQAHLTSEDVYMPITPMFHVHAWGFPYFFTMIGAKQIYIGRYEPELILKLIKKENVTFSHCVPTILHMMLNSPDIKDVDLSNWQVIIGGAALPKALCKQALDLGVNIYAGYGMSETCPMLTGPKLKPETLALEPEKQVEARCRTGLPAPLVNLRIIDSKGNPLPHDGNATGEVVVRSPWLTQGYTDDPERSEELWDGGWLHTGDIGYVDYEGCLQITDRMKDVIKTGGEWISSLELEDIISQHEAVSEAVAIGVPDDKWGERPMCIIVLKDNYKGKVDTDELKQFVMKYVEDGTIPKYGVPDKIVFTDTIPKTSVGKMDKKVLREQYN